MKVQKSKASSMKSGEAKSKREGAQDKGGMDYNKGNFISADDKNFSTARKVHEEKEDKHEKQEGGEGDLNSVINVTETQSSNDQQISD